MTTLVLGKNGQVGWELQRALAPLGKLIALDRNERGRLSGDLSDLEALRQTVRELKPDLIVNAAAYTAVDQAEEDREIANLVNAEAPAMLAEEAKALNALLVHYSTDYVFDGSGTRPWKESDAASPLNHYGATKLAGEQAIQASGASYLIFRTSWVYAVRSKNFLVAMSKLIRDRNELNVIDDQVGAPTSAELIADVTAHAVRQVHNDSEFQGLYHLVAAGETTWFGYAGFISRWLQDAGVEVGVTPDRINPIASRDWQASACRPLNSRLATTKLEEAFRLQLPPWESGVERALVEQHHQMKIRIYYGT